MDRYYPTYNVTVRDSIVATLLLWNSSDEYSNEDNDFMFTQFLLIDIFGAENLAAMNLEETKLKFIKELFIIRVKDNMERASRFNQYIENVSKLFKAKVAAEHK